MSGSVKVFYSYSGVSRKIHPQNSHQQSSATGNCEWQGAFWLQRLPPARAQAEYGANATGVHSAVFAAHPAQGLCAHPALRLFEQHGQGQASA